MKDDTIRPTERERHLLVRFAGRLAAETPNEREIALKRINAELMRLKISWTDIFEKALPKAGTTPVAGSHDQTTEDPVRRLSGDEIPLVVSGAVSEIIERPWQDGTMMFVTITGRHFVYGPLVVFDDAAQKVVHEAAGHHIVGKVQHAEQPNQTPILSSIMIE